MFTPQQQAVIDAITSGQSIASRAVAGSGKTTTAIGAIAKVTTPGLALAFNKKNADELALRIKASNPTSRVEAKTLNALGHRVWSDHLSRRLIVSMDKSKDIIRERGWKLEPEAWAALVRMVSIGKARLISPGNMKTSPPDIAAWREAWDEISGDTDLFDNLVEQATEVLQISTRKAWDGLIDFDDQLYMPVLFNSNFPRLPFVCVDEAQDLSNLQHEMVSRLRPSQVLVVGDPNQAIYGFRGASSSSFDELVERFNLSLLALTVSFRCPKAVARIAQNYVPDFEAGPDAPEGEVNTITEPPLRGTAICRYNAPLLRLAFRALRQRISVDYLGKDFLAGIKALNTKYPTPSALDNWLAQKLREAKTDGARKRAQDQYDSLQTLHEVARRESTDVAAIIANLLNQSKLGAQLTLSTVHKAKGLEWPEVTFLNYDADATEGQEPNINYVGVTRAQRVLNLQIKQR